MADQKRSSMSKSRPGKTDSSQMQFDGFDEPVADPSQEQLQSPVAADAVIEPPAAQSVSHDRPPSVSSLSAGWTLNTEVAPCELEPTPDLQDQLVVVVDSHSLIYQLFHALPPMNSPHRPAGLDCSWLHRRHAGVGSSQTTGLCDLRL